MRLRLIVLLAVVGLSAAWAASSLSWPSGGQSIQGQVQPVGCKPPNCN